MQPTAAGNCSVRNEKMYRQMALNGQGDQGQTSIIGRDQANQGNLGGHGAHIWQHDAFNNQQME